MKKRADTDTNLVDNLDFAVSKTKGLLELLRFYITAEESNQDCIREDSIDDVAFLVLSVQDELCTSYDAADWQPVGERVTS